MNPKKSRADLLDIGKLRASQNIYELIIIAAARAYELRKGAQAKITDFADPYNSGVMTALLEIQQEL